MDKLLSLAAFVALAYENYCKVKRSKLPVAKFHSVYLNALDDYRALRKEIHGY